MSIVPTQHPQGHHPVLGLLAFFLRLLVMVLFVILLSSLNLFLPDVTYGTLSSLVTEI